jgi:ADP-ribose 1''-phosphate phosphatase
MHDFRSKQMTIEYCRGNLFDAPLVPYGTSFLAHACNAQGVWGSGVAAEFKKRYRLEYFDYREFCQEALGSRSLVGKCLLTGRVACLITSHDFGPRVDEPGMILRATREAFKKLLDMTLPGDVINMPKINSGLFHVPWELTAAVLDECLVEFPGVKVVIWEPKTFAEAIKEARGGDAPIDRQRFG